MKIFLLIILISFRFALAQNIIFEDDMDGDNTISGLQARGWVVLNVDGGGSTNAFYQGVPSVFPAFQGPDSGYVAANYLGANSQGQINQWLISPAINVHSGDSLSFYARAANSTAYMDSIDFLISPTAGTTPADFQDLGRNMLDRNNWKEYYYKFTANGTYRFAIAYFMTDSARANFIGLDYFRLFSQYSVYPSSITLSKTFSFIDITNTSSYRMIGLPGNNSILISSLINGTQKTDWNAYYDNGEAQNYLIEFNGGSNFNFGQGRGFWVLSKNAITVSQTVNTVTLNPDNTYSISLHPGWNIITDPFEKNVVWSDVQNKNGLAANLLIYSWKGSWSNPTSMTPYEGYYFNNAPGLTSLKIPYPTTTMLGKKQEQSSYNINPNSNLKISLIQNGRELSKSIVNFDSKASNDFDNEDYFAPPGDFDAARINLYNKNLSAQYKQLFIESRPAINNGQSFDLNYKNTTGNDLELKIEGTNNFPGYEVYLLDKDLNQFYNLKQQSTIQINSKIKKRNYTLLIGTHEFINSLKTELMPHEFSLYQNYPNPFNPTTTIRYQVPVQSHVTIKIYDILGNEVKTLLNKEEQPGIYEVEFSGLNLSSGVYFYKIVAGSFIQTKKMLLLK